MEFLGSEPAAESWKETLKSEITKHEVTPRTGTCRMAIDINDVMELILARDDLKYHSIDLVAVLETPLSRPVPKPINYRRIPSTDKLYKLMF